MKRHALITLLILSCLSHLAASVLPGWGTNLPSALAEAKISQQPVLVYFTASWCGPCKLMARTTFTNDAVRGALENVGHVVVDIDEQSGLAALHAVQAVPAFEMLAPSGDKTARTTSYQEAEPFLQWLTNSTAGVSTAVLRKKHLEERFAKIRGLLDDGGEVPLRQAAGELFDLCADKDGVVRKSATALLTRVMEQNPALLLDGLDHPRLAARVEVANLLRARLGEAFDVDPWSDGPGRRKAIALWRGKLALKPASEKIP